MLGVGYWVLDGGRSCVGCWVLWWETVGYGGRWWLKVIRSGGKLEVVIGCCRWWWELVG